MKDRNIFEVCGTIISLESESITLQRALAHQLEYFRVPNSKNIEYDVIISDYHARPSERETQVASDYYYFSEGYLNIPEHRLSFNIEGDVHYYFLDNFVIPVNLIVQLALIRQGKTLVHSAAISINGNSILFPALGGVGKTTIVSHAMQKGGFLYGDDMNIIDRDATLYPYPIDFSVYDYHYDLLGIEKRLSRKISLLCSKFLKVFDDFPVLSWLTKRVRGKYFPECENISPIKIYGSDCVATSCSVRKFIFLGRHLRCRDQLLENIMSNEIAADRITSVLLSEWKDSLGFLQIYSTFSEAFSYVDMCNTIHSIAFEAVSRAEKSDISVASSITNQEYIEVLWENVLQIE